MRRVARVRAVTIVLGLALCAALGSAGPAVAATGSISGKVVDATTKAGISQIWVCTHSAFLLGPFGGCAFTDVNGEYTIPAIEPSSYVVVFNEEGRQGHLAQYYDGAATREGAETVTVGDGQLVTGIDAELGESGKIAGNVTDVDSGLPIEGVETCAPEAGGFKDGAVTHCDKTDVDGDYLIEGLATGSYKVEFRVEEEPNYIAQYYNGKGSLAEAEPVSVVAPLLTDGIDAAMKEGVQITGRLTEAGSGNPVKWIRVCALQAGTEAVRAAFPRAKTAPTRSPAFRSTPMWSASPSTSKKTASSCTRTGTSASTTTASRPSPKQRRSPAWSRGCTPASTRCWCRGRKSSRNAHRRRSRSLPRPSAPRRSRFVARGASVRNSSKASNAA